MQLLPYSAPQHLFKRRVAASKSKELVSSASGGPEPKPSGNQGGVALRMNPLFLAMELGKENWAHGIIDQAIEREHKARAATKPAEGGRMPVSRNGRKRGEKHGQAGDGKSGAGESAAAVKSRAGQAGAAEGVTEESRERVVLRWLNDKIGAASNQTVLLRCLPLAPCHHSHHGNNLPHHGIIALQACRSAFFKPGASCS